MEKPDYITETIIITVRLTATTWKPKAYVGWQKYTGKRKIQTMLLNTNTWKQCLAHKVLKLYVIALGTKKATSVWSNLFLPYASTHDHQQTWNTDFLEREGGFDSLTIDYLSYSINFQLLKLLMHLRFCFNSLPVFYWIFLLCLYC